MSKETQLKCLINFIKYKSKLNKQPKLPNVVERVELKDIHLVLLEFVNALFEYKRIHSSQ